MAGELVGVLEMALLSVCTLMPDTRLLYTVWQIGRQAGWLSPSPQPPPLNAYIMHSSSPLLFPGTCCCCHCTTQDVGGLSEAKAALQEALALPFR